MENAKKWMNTNLNALLDSAEENIIGIVGTRYSEDDCYRKFVDNAREVVGTVEGAITPIPGGRWSIYYRLVREDGQMVAPEIISEKTLSEMDPWTSATQYWNDPQKSGYNEFIRFVVKPAKLFSERESGRKLLSFRDELSDEVRRSTALP